MHFDYPSYLSFTPKIIFTDKSSSKSLHSGTPYLFSSLTSSSSSSSQTSSSNPQRLSSAAVHCERSLTSRDCTPALGATVALRLFPFSLSLRLHTQQELQTHLRGGGEATREHVCGVGGGRFAVFAELPEAALPRSRRAFSVAMQRCVEREKSRWKGERET